MNKNKPLEVIFAPGCFDDFEGTQEELDKMIKEITDIFSSGNLDNAKITPLENMPDEEFQEFLDHMERQEGSRTLH